MGTSTVHGVCFLLGFSMQPLVALKELQSYRILAKSLQSAVYIILLNSRNQGIVKKTTDTAETKIAG